MTVLYFAHARRLTGRSDENIPLDHSIDTATLWALLIQKHPDLAPLRTSSRLARNDEFLPANALLRPEDEIAIIPPVSGG